MLTGCVESARLYGTQLLRACVRARVVGVERWAVDALVAQLYDQSRSVAYTALSVLDEAADYEVETLELK